MTHATALPLAGRVAFVTGAGQGLGAAIARGLAQAGARVALADIDEANAQAVAAEANGLALPLDVRDEQAFGDRFAQAVAHFGAVDILVNNAARTPTTSLWDITPAEWDDVLAINLRGSFFGCRIAGRHMRARGTGRIVNLASLAGQQVSSATGVHYAASKAGLLALTRAFAQELAPHGVTVNALAPAAIDSPALAALPPERQQALKAGIPLGRFGLADEVAAAAVYLASPAAAFMTGATLDLNGGRFMR
ncbi:3-oxoacyl-[acyl-carrier protein] reductase [Variovorax boronicumulans]|uniref:3-oxoacyl-[acyl-carrier protein] reductase n=1 Tax=Variovorax boronicumulans TaxID=436515 RepID=A0AAW8DYU6_9BURK|nr:SDR family NAD(P)-dependent oxidoreductase [Variovorax boronicumulans]MDP9879777.1 3-oxoacyl-[acyl-carrier protein] reductase [Variovorax boronicumulans]MDP9924545.1 3-oxoacyl-[acyl-carrier protein] reductase [Variovorax boronicumulans]